MLFFTLSFYLKTARYFRTTPFISTCKVQKQLDSLVKSKTVTQEETLNWMLQSFSPQVNARLKGNIVFIWTTLNT